MKPACLLTDLRQQRTQLDAALWSPVFVDDCSREHIVR